MSSAKLNPLKGSAVNALTSTRANRKPSILQGLIRQRMAVVAIVWAILVVLSAIFAPLLSPYDPAQQDLMNKFASASPEHWLGTDEFGRDIFSRLLYGGRTTLIAALIAVGVSITVGLPAGLVSGYRGGKIDGALSRAFEGLQSIPALILALTIVAVLGPGIVNAMIAVGMVLSPQFFRVARATAMGVMGETFIEASVAIGCTPRRLMVVHVLPNVIPSIMVQASVVLGVAVSSEASLSFLGIGVLPPAASWGSMLSSAASAMFIAPDGVWAPGLMIFSVVLSFTLAAEGLRQAINRSALKE